MGSQTARVMTEHRLVYQVPKCPQMFTSRKDCTISAWVTIPNLILRSQVLSCGEQIKSQGMQLMTSVTISHLTKALQLEILVFLYGLGDSLLQ